MHWERSHNKVQFAFRVFRMISEALAQTVFNKRDWSPDRVRTPSIPGTWTSANRLRAFSSSVGNGRAYRLAIHPAP